MFAESLLALALLAAASPTPSRILLCRSRIVAGEDEARRAAVVAAARSLGGRFLDYGVVCDDIPEAARAARRAGLRRALSSTVERKGQMTSYVLSLAEASTGLEVARREVAVVLGDDPVPPLRRALREIERGFPVSRLDSTQLDSTVRCSSGSPWTIVEKKT
jgi:hypothetical protein